jgi:hypothetical protein
MKLSEGCQVVVLPYGGRVLGLFAPNEPRNFLWVNPALRHSSSARAFFRNSNWQNTGGDRTWLGPEIDFFFPDFPDLGTYCQPRPLDAGTFSVTRSPGSIILSLRLRVASRRQRKSAHLRLTKRIESASDPLRSDGNLSLQEAVRYAGYSVHTRLSFATGGGQPASVGLWSLLQLPQGGEMIIPTYGSVVPATFFGKVPKSDIRLKSSCFRCRMRRGALFKVALKATATTGRVGHYSECDGEAELVIRNFFINPSGPYGEAPRSDLGDVGYCVQLCNVSERSIGNFSELEYHVPAIGDPAWPKVSEDVSQLWAYRGPPAQLARIARRLLGTPPSR